MIRTRVQREGNKIKVQVFEDEGTPVVFEMTLTEVVILQAQLEKEVKP